MATDVYCTRCGRELEPFEDVVIVASGAVIPTVHPDYAAQASESPYLEIICEECQEPKPNRVVVETTGAILSVRAERPGDVVVIVQNPGGPMIFPKQRVWGTGRAPIGKLNTVKEEA